MEEQRRRKGTGWNVDLEGEIQKLEVVGLMSGTEGESVDPEGKMGHWSARIMRTKAESEEPKGAEMEVDGAVPQEARVEIQSPKRKVFRVESVETQYYVREDLAISEEEAEKLGCVPNALGEPPGIRYWQIASLVVEEGGEARTINLCQQC